MFMYLSIIIPAYNEEKKIATDIEEAFKYLGNSKYKGEVIVSTDGVTDNTNNIVGDLQKKYKNLILLTEKNKIGKGAAIKAGVSIAKGKYIMFADAGLCVPFRYINDGLKKINEGFDMILASRALKTSKIERKQPLYRQLGSRIFSLIVRFILGIPRQIKDTQCGFKIYNNAVAKDLFQQLQTQAMMFDIELILRAKKKGYKIAVFPVDWKNDADTKLKPVSGSIKILNDLYRIKIVYKL